MMHHTTFDVGLRVAAYFLTINHQIVASGEFGRYTQLRERIDNRLRKSFEIEIHSFIFVGNNSVVQVVQIVIHGSSARNTPHNMNAVLFHVFLIDFLEGVLVFPYDDCRFIYPQYKYFIVMQQFFETIFFKSYVVIGFVGFIDDVYQFFFI